MVRPLVVASSLGCVLLACAGCHPGPAETGASTPGSSATTIERVSLAAGGAQLPDHSSGVGIGADGRYAVFLSRAATLPGANGSDDFVYRFDRTTNTVDLAAGVDA